MAKACRLAQRAHAAQVDASGEPYVAHLGRVAAAVPLFARPVAWLHDALGCTNVDEAALIAAGASAPQLRAVCLLTREKAVQSDDAYMAHVRAIALAEGYLGDIARVVKRADLLDHVAHPAPRHDRWTPPYRAALVVLTMMNNKTAASSRRARQRLPWPSHCGEPADGSRGNRRDALDLIRSSAHR